MPLCKYYSKGFCQCGENCKFQHDPAVACTPCKHFLAGACRNAEKCAYMHDDAKDVASESPEKVEERRLALIAPDAPPDAEVCRYDPNCYRLNPEHLRKYRHPSREALPPPRPAVNGKSCYDWAAIRKALPSDRTPSQAEARKKLFKVMDFNGNGIISLAEVDKCVIETLGMGEIFPKKVLLRAFYAANGVAPKNGTLSDDMVSFSEFRVLMCALRRYLECFEVFDAVDRMGERDGRLETAEVEKAIPLLRDLGLPAAAADELLHRTTKPPMATMACAVAAKNHMVLFEEFCRDFALKHDLNIQPDDGFGRMFHGQKPVKRWGEF